jgi:membrane protein DedA with SNARE-associated domain
LGLRSARAGWQKTELSCSGERIVASDVAEPAEERRAFVDRGTRELAQGMLGSWARQELTAADRQGPELQQPLVLFGQSAYIVGQDLDRASVLIQTFSSPDAWYAERGGVEEEVTNDGVAGGYRHWPGRPVVPWPERKHSAALPETKDFFTVPIFPTGTHPDGSCCVYDRQDRCTQMDWSTHLLPILAAFLDQYGLLSAFVLLLLEEAGVPLPVPGDVLMLVVGVRVHQSHLVLWQVLAVMEAATVLGAGSLYAVSAHAGRPLAYRYGRFLRLNPERLGRAEDWIRQGGWRAIVLLRLVPGLRIATVVGCGIFGVPFRLFLPALAFGGFGYLVVYTLLGYFVGPEILAVLTQLHA